MGFHKRIFLALMLVFLTLENAGAEPWSAASHP